MSTCHPLALHAWCHLTGTEAHRAELRRPSSSASPPVPVGPRRAESGPNPVRPIPTMEGACGLVDPTGRSKLEQATEGAGTGDSQRLCLPFSLWATVLPPRWAGRGDTQLSSIQSRLTSSGLHNQGEDASSPSCRDWSPREEADWCELSLPYALSRGQNEAGASRGPSGPEHGLGCWGRAADPTEGGHSPGQERTDAGQTKAWVMWDLSCQHPGLNERSWGQNKPHLRTRVK